MGYFSFITSDTNRSIPIVGAKRKTFTVHLITEDHQVYTEGAYDGYGVFGDMDIYSLIGYLNGFKGNSDTVRNKTFDELIGGGIRKGKKKYFFRKDFKHYEEPIEKEGGKTANQLVKEEGFVSIFPRFEFEEFENEGIQVPKLVQKLPKDHELMTDKEWKIYYHSLPHTKGCPAQGIYY